MGKEKEQKWEREKIDELPCGHSVLRLRGQACDGALLCSMTWL